MLKFILKRMIKDSNNGLESTVFITVDCRSEELELLLTKGGVSESGYDVTDMVGVEIIPPAKTSELAATVPPEDGRSQQLKAEIAALVNLFPVVIPVAGCHTALVGLVSKLRQLSAV